MKHISTVIGAAGLMVMASPGASGGIVNAGRAAEAAKGPGAGPVPGEKANPFTSLFAGVRYVAIKMPADPKPFESGAEAGTKQYALCDILMENVGGIAGVHMPGYRIVKRVSADGKKVRLLCVPPQFSKGGPLKAPYINVSEASQTVKDSYQAFLDGLLKGFIGWAEKRVADGLPFYDGKASSGGAGTVEQVIDDARLTELGI